MQLSSGGKKRSGVSAQAFLKGIWSGRGSTPPPSAPPDPEEQTTLASAFDAAGPPPGEPSRPAQDHISLDSVFGDEAARRASPAAEAASLASDGSKTGGFSFDEFFAGGKASGDSAATGSETSSPKTPGGSRTSGRAQRPPEDEGEADQFQQWLKKLKS